MVHEIFHDMARGEEFWFDCTIHVSNQSHGSILKIVARLNSNIQ